MVDQQPLDLSMAKPMDLRVKDGSSNSNIVLNIPINDNTPDAEDNHMFPQPENKNSNNLDLNQTYFQLPECTIGNTTHELIETILWENQFDLNNNLPSNIKTCSNENLNNVVTINEYIAADFSQIPDSNNSVSNVKLDKIENVPNNISLITGQIDNVNGYENTCFFFLLNLVQSAILLYH